MADQSRHLIFISYRGSDQNWAAELVYARMTEAFGTDAVFKAGNALRAGENFPPILKKEAASCPVMLACIGPGWLTATAPDPAFERSRLLEATCLVDLADFRTATALFDQGMTHLGAARTGYARLAIRHAIAYANIGEPEHACKIMLGSLPTVTRQGSASLRGDLKLLSRALIRYRRSSAVLALLPDLTTAARATSIQARHPATDDSRGASVHG